MNWNLDFRYYSKTVVFIVSFICIDEVLSMYGYKNCKKFE